jgi:UDP-3-O-[3-hydroxymyristoyl] glucosamine N-acyltransferase
VKDPVYLSNSLSVQETTDLVGRVQLGDTLSVKEQVYLSNSLSVETTTDLVGRVQLGNTLSVLGDTEISGNLSIIQNTEIGGTLSVLGDTEISGNLSIIQNAKIGGTLSIFGVLDVEGDTTDKDLHIGKIKTEVSRYGFTFNKNLDTDNVNKVFFYEENGQLIIAKEESSGLVVPKHIFR